MYPATGQAELLPRGGDFDGSSEFFKHFPQTEPPIPGERGETEGLWGMAAAGRPSLSKWEHSLGFAA
jgi:hypothetical protein